MMLNLLKKYSEDLRPQAVDFCQRLIQTPALSGNEKAVADLYLKEMNKLGYDQVFRDDWGNVVGIIQGVEPGPTIMYNSHLDHVDPGDPSEWEGYDPYGGEIDVVEVDDQDRIKTELAEVIHGRAAADVKGGGATQIYAGATILKLREMGYKFKGNFMFTGVVLEEPAEQLGMIKLIEETFSQKGLDYDCVVSSEATSLKLYLGHRGKMEILITVYGRTSHASTPWLGINAVNKATKLIEKIENELIKKFDSDPELGCASIALTNISCTPGELAITPDRCYITYDRRLIPQETSNSCLQEIQNIIDQLSKEDSEFKASVEVSTRLRTSYTGKSAKVPNFKEAWKISKEHPVVKVSATALEEIGQSIKYGYWDFGTDLSKVVVSDGKPAIGYSPMQEQYCHRPIDKVRTDYMEKSIAGNAAIFYKLVELDKEDFRML
ncbi:MAG: M20/M25/M40 family metallo-hydrolase [Peptococcales bacterium]|jgi:putative selenium metabolism hydrolase